MYSFLWSSLEGMGTNLGKEPPHGSPFRPRSPARLSGPASPQGAIQRRPRSPSSPFGPSEISNPLSAPSRPVPPPLPSVRRARSRRDDRRIVFRRRRMPGPVLRALHGVPGNVGAASGAVSVARASVQDLLGVHGEQWAQMHLLPQPRRRVTGRSAPSRRACCPRSRSLLGVVPQHGIETAWSASARQGEKNSTRNHERKRAGMVTPLGCARPGYRE